MVTKRGLVYGICAGPSGKYHRLARPGIEAIAADAVVWVAFDQESIHSAYQTMIERARDQGVGGLVLLHDDVVIRDSLFPAKVEKVFEDPDVGVVGVVGARRPVSAEWWWYESYGWVEETASIVDKGRTTTDVDVVDGVLLALSPSALRIVNLDATMYPGFHGYDLEICSQTRAAGLRVVVVDTDIFHDSYPSGKVNDPPSYVIADRVWRRRWARGIGNGIRYRMAVWENGGPSMRVRIRRILSP